MSAGTLARVGTRALLLLLIAPGQALTAQEDVATYLQSVRSNVVRVEAGSMAGFGFIVGLGERTVLIATAEHTVQDENAVPRICFLERPAPCPEGTLVYRDDPRAPGDPDLDLALIETPYPVRLPWRPDVLGVAPSAGEPAWFIGRNEGWFLPATPGRILSSDAATGDLAYTGMLVAAGVSGAPILVSDGIVGMHLESSGANGDSRGILLGAIRNRVEERLGRQWVLVPRATCPHDVTQRILANRWVTVRFPWHRAAAALDAMARLRCAGALPLPSPLWEAPGGEREIIYRNGDLRSARVLQTLLSPLGRIETRLGVPEGELELILQ